jgi:(p)ppGpp synthase/HD superfamily hydrolase
MTEHSQLHLTGRFTSAIDYARCIHIERRKGTEIPYMAHLLGVAALVMGEAGQVSFPVTEDMVIAAVLHDAAEDHGGTLRLNDIEQNFGANVARMVAGLLTAFRTILITSKVGQSVNLPIFKCCELNLRISSSFRQPTSFTTQEQS